VERADDIRTLEELAAALADDPRFAGYEVATPSEGVVEVRVGEAGLAVVDERVFADPARLEPHLTRSRAGSTRLVFAGNEDALVAAATGGDPSELALWVLPMSRARAAMALPAELDLVALRARARERGRTADRYRYELGELLAISRAIASERDVEKLLGMILEKSRYVTGADAGSIYIVEGDHLRIMVSQNDSVAVDFRAFALPVDDRSIVGKAVTSRTAVNIPDLLRLGEPGANPWGVRHNRSLDEKTGYRARSMLTFPLVNARDEVIGVIQLINRKRVPEARLHDEADFAREVVPFDQRSVELCETLAAQAGVTLENALLYAEIQRLFEGFVSASVTAIEQRDPTTSGHSQRVAELTVGLAQTVEREGAGPWRGLRFTVDDLKQIEYAGLLHDFGKVGVRENVLVKAKKLYDHQRDLLLLRFDYIRKSIESEGLARRVALLERRADVLAAAAGDADPGEALRRLDEMVAFVLRANEPTVLAEGSFDRLVEIAANRYVDARGEARPYLQPEEVESLRIQRGSLRPDERLEIESHVTHTYNFLATIPWGRKLRRIPTIAGAHHEKLDGTGYPRGLRAEEIPVESKMMTIADIFDALTASDRPYKKAVPLERALDILADEVKRGKCDPDLFRLFVEAKVWQRVLVASS
jgi:HD-GYP domain-containing protein (c-di-GMP phosphodiesterase class II)